MDRIKEKLHCIAGYLGLLFIIPIFFSNGSKLAQFHGRQGAILFGLFILSFDLLNRVHTEAVSTQEILAILKVLLISFYLVLNFLGIYYASTHQEKHLPLLKKVTKENI